MSKGLTKKQNLVLKFVVDYIDENGYPPAIREIGTHFSIGSLRGVTVHLDALERKGFIERANTPRSIRVIHPQYQSAHHVVMLPLIGSIAAGVPILADQDVEAHLPIPSQMVRNVEGAFLLRVKGDSMVGDGIMPRDLVVIKPQVTANNNDIVAALLGDEATVKRIQFSPSGVKLLASNPAYPPIEVRREDASIIGKVVGLIRDYDGMAF